MTKPHKYALITGGIDNLGRLVADRLLDQCQTIIKFGLPGTEPKQPRTGEHVVSGDVTA